MNGPGLFTRFASRVAHWSGSPVAVALAAATVILWAIAGPFFGFSDVWQLTINTGTTIITFLMVFIIQNSQNRDSEALQIKLDELIRATRLAHNSLLDLEKLDQRDLDKFRDHYAKLAEEARKDGIDIAGMLSEIKTEEEVIEDVTRKVAKLERRARATGKRRASGRRNRIASGKAETES